MNIYVQIYVDTDTILGKPVYFNGALLGRTEQATDIKFNKLKEYFQQYKISTNIGILHTVLVILKPIKSNPILQPEFDEFRSIYENNNKKKSKLNFKLK